MGLPSRHIRLWLVLLVGFVLGFLACLFFVSPIRLAGAAGQEYEPPRRATAAVPKVQQTAVTWTYTDADPSTSDDLPPSFDAGLYLSKSRAKVSGAVCAGRNQAALKGAWTSHCCNPQGLSAEILTAFATSVVIRISNKYLVPVVTKLTKQHWKDYGQQEGRNGHCEEKETKINGVWRSPCYLSPTEAKLAFKHYQTAGHELGLVAPVGQSMRANRGAIIGSIAEQWGLDSLEIGPFAKPLLRGEHAKYFDVLTREGMLKMLAKMDKNERFMNSGSFDMVEVAKRVPAIIHYQHDQADLASIPLKNHFQLIMSSHALEHQPDLVRHLQKVSRLLRKGGYYLAFVPNKRFCFDHYKAVSNMSWAPSRRLALWLRGLTVVTKCGDSFRADGGAAFLRS
jgi:SAM-dependent methyltransferase